MCMLYNCLDNRNNIEEGCEVHIKRVILRDLEAEMSV